jgi:hypothetical protein
MPDAASEEMSDSALCQAVVGVAQEQVDVA